MNDKYILLTNMCVALVACITAVSLMMGFGVILDQDTIPCSGIFLRFCYVLCCLCCLSGQTESQGSHKIDFHFQ